MDFYTNLNTFSLNSNLILKRAHYRTNGTKTEYGPRHLVRASDHVVGELFSSKSKSWILVALQPEERAELQASKLHGSYGRLMYNQVFRYVTEKQTGLVHVNFEKGQFQFETYLKHGEEGIRWGAYYFYYNVVLDSKSHFENLYTNHFGSPVIWKADQELEWDKLESHYEADCISWFSNYDIGDFRGHQIIKMKISKCDGKWFHSFAISRSYQYKHEVGFKTLKAAKAATMEILRNGFVMDSGIYFCSNPEDLHEGIMKQSHKSQIAKLEKYFPTKNS